MKRHTVPNPAGGRKPVELITDRAKRYRANADIGPGAAVCGYCGGASEMIDHIDGREEHGEPANLMRACRSCNTTKANVMREAGLGRKTVQFNPDAEGAASLAQWAWAVSRVRRRDPKTGRLLPLDAWKVEAPAAEVKQAVAMIRATSPSKRAEFASALRARRRLSKRSSSGDVPF